MKIVANPQSLEILERYLLDAVKPGPRKNEDSIERATLCQKYLNILKTLPDQAFFCSICQIEHDDHGQRVTFLVNSEELCGPGGHSFCAAKLVDGDTKSVAVRMVLG